MIWGQVNFPFFGKDFAVCTLHRPSNVDDSEQLNSLVKVLCDISSVPIVFPTHPRTQKNLYDETLQHANLHVLDPQGYLEFLYLQKEASYVVTDSGGIQEETTYLGIPCLTLRSNTERPETVEFGSNKLLGNDIAAIKEAICVVESGKWKKSRCPDYWDGKAGGRIVEILLKILSAGL